MFMTSGENPQFGTQESEKFKEFAREAQAIVERMFMVLKETAPRVPQVRGDDPAAVAAEVAQGLQIDTEKKSVAPMLDPDVLSRVQEEMGALRKQVTKVMEDPSFPDTDRQRVWHTIDEIWMQFAKRGISL